MVSSARERRASARQRVSASARQRVSASARQRVSASARQCVLMLFGTKAGSALLTVSTTLPIWR